MKNALTCFLFFTVLFTTQMQAQTLGVLDTPRILTYGEATQEVPADMITASLNIYDINYDYTAPYDAKRMLNNQIAIIERLGCKEFMTNPKYKDLSSYVGGGPFELKFTSKEQFEQMRNKAAAMATEETAVSLDYMMSEISPAKRKQIKDQLLDQALADAKSRAEKIAKGLAVILGGVLVAEEIMDYTTYGGGYDPEGYGMYNTNMTVVVTSKVQIQYAIGK
jgi:predicted secreted protein